MPSPVQFNEKVDHFLAQLFAIGVDESVADAIEMFPSKETHYRMRAEFRVWHDGDTANYAMHRPDTKEVYTLSHFPAASELINTVMPQLMERINQCDLLRQRLFQIEFLSSLQGELLVSMIYHKPLDNAWENAAKQLEHALNIFIIGRARKQKCVLSRDYIMESLTVAGTDYQYQQIENSFTQPNATICIKMLEWVLKQAQQLNPDQQKDLLELYCGNGNFTIPLAQHFRKVLATEVSKTSVKSALFNAELNHVNNLSIARLASEEVSQALDKVRPFRRLKNIDLDSYHFDTLLVDPPRAGLDNQTLELAKRFTHIIYISCNPRTLINNLTQLTTHRVQAVAAFDQFPMTPHLEVGVILEKQPTTA